MDFPEESLSDTKTDAPPLADDNTDNTSGETTPIMNFEDDFCDEANDSPQVIEKIGNTIESEEESDSEETQYKINKLDDDFVEDDNPWFEDDMFNMEEMSKLCHAKQLQSEDITLGLEFGGFSQEKEQNDELIGDFVKIDFPVPEDCNVGADIDLTKLEKLFDTPEILALKEQFELHGIKAEAESNDSNELELETVPEVPIIPDFEMDYENIYENIGKVSEIEKQLQLLFRPFTCLIDVNCRFSLYELAILLDDARYEPAHHPALSVRLHNPSAEVKIYTNGKITSSALTADSARTALLKIIQLVEELDYKTDITLFSKNIVHASFCMPFKIDLELLCELHSDNVSYNRDTRPFITYKIDGTGIRFAVFANGFVLVLHSNQHSETRAAIAGFLPILSQFQNGYLTPSEKYGSLDGDISFRLLWERKIEDDCEGILLYS